MESNPSNTVVVVHTGWQPYLELCLRRAVECNPGGRVVLLGDGANAHLQIGEHCLVTDPSLQTDIPEFHAIYQHHSRSHGFKFERFCLERWLLIRNLLRREGLLRCLAIDSDVLLFCNVADETYRWRHVAMTLGRWDAVRCVPHCNFIQSLAALEAFCDYFLNVYRQPAELDRLNQLNRRKLDNVWVSDMSFFADWKSTGRQPVGMLEEMLDETGGFDTCIDNTCDYEPCGYLPGILRQWKRIKFENGAPYAFRKEDGRRVRMKCLHYHGQFKAIMERHARCESDSWGSAATLLRLKLKRLPSKATLFYNNYVASLFKRKKLASGPSPRNAADAA